MKKAIIMMIVVFALVVWPFSGVWQLLSGIIGGGVRESFIYPIYGGIILLSGIIVVCTELILEEIKSLKDDIKDKKEKNEKENTFNFNLVGMAAVYAGQNIKVKESVQ